MKNCSHSPFISEEIRSRVLSAMTECILPIQRGTEQGLIRRINPLLCTQMISGMLIAAIQGWQLGKYPMDEKVFEQVIEMAGGPLSSEWG